MKVLHIATLDKGGSFNATLRLHRELIVRGIDSKILVLLKYNDYPQVYEIYEEYNRTPLKYFFAFKKLFWYGLNKLLLIGRNKQYEIFSGPFTLVDITKNKHFKEADIVNLHWVSYFLDWKRYFKTEKPTLWRLSDMNPFTCGPHITDDSRDWKEISKNCTQIRNAIFPIYGYYNLKHKLKATENAKNLYFAGLSNWITNASKESLLFNRFEHRTIHNGFDSKAVNQNLNIVKDKIKQENEAKIILFVSDDLTRENKGFHFLKKILPTLNLKDYTLLIVGHKAENIEIDGINIRFTGFLKGDELALTYTIATLTLVPSLWESFSNVTLESLSYGTPVVAWDNSGPADIIQHKLNGYLAEAYNPLDFARGIRYIIENHSKIDFKKLAVERVQKKFSIEKMADKYIKYYQDILLKKIEENNK